MAFVVRQDRNSLRSLRNALTKYSRGPSSACPDERLLEEGKHLKPNQKSSARTVEIGPAPWDCPLENEKLASHCALVFFHGSK